MKLAVSIGLLLAFLQKNPATSFKDDEWDYGEKGPETGAWCNISPMCCNGKRQSPFVIYQNITKFSFTYLEFKNYDKEREFKMVNNGKTVVLMENQNNNSKERPMISLLPYPNIENALLDSSYVFHSMQFHWGSNNSLGSEHAFEKPDNKASMEIQLIHYKSTLNGYDNAIKSEDKDALLILSIMIVTKVDQLLNGKSINIYQSAFDSILKGIPNIIKPGQTTTVTVNLSKIYDSALTYNGITAASAKILWYLGSLTTPPCKEIVVWYILDTTYVISEGMMDIFRKLEGKGGASLSNNFRPLNLQLIQQYEKRHPGGKLKLKKQWLPRKFYSRKG